ncbi:trifunctional hydroxymethylpyrimidine kinase/phosphomethylpyrimidine kinase/thiaminase [Malassezia sp. CBS 17886]|nr:trifunctional hydroxymethylpyrimidine kinase/phosphomethylpyrimidine kinase/thiaminase [Malassezia sp. CBS 17886]
MPRAHVLTVAGSDSGGGAGIQADLKTFFALDTYGMSVLTALTAQNTCGVEGIHMPPPTFIEQQFDCVARDMRIDGIKIGMLANADVVRTVAACIRRWRHTRPPDAPVVLDPVMVSTSGSALLSDGAVSSVVTELLPVCSVVTPNLMEAAHILKHSPSAEHQRAVAGEEPLTLEKMLRMAAMVVDMGAPNALVKGGHARVPRAELARQLAAVGLDVAERVDDVAAACTRDARGAEEEVPLAAGNASSAAKDDAAIMLSLGASVLRHNDTTLFFTRADADVAALGQFGGSGAPTYTVDVLVETVPVRQTTIFARPTVDTTATHGTGCTLSAAICAAQASGTALRCAVAEATAFMQDALRAGDEELGEGAGPLDHGALVQRSAIPTRNARLRTPLTTSLIARSWALWVSYTRHPFVAQLAQGTLPERAFTWFLRQDYVYLKHYARLWATAAADATCSLEERDAYASLARSTVQEVEALHVCVCGAAGITRAALEATHESRATMVYTRFLLDTAREGLLPLLASAASCAIGYAEVGRRLQGAMPVEHRPYAEWIAEYSGSEFQAAAARTVDLLEARAEEERPGRAYMARLQHVWDVATRLEIGMWDEALAHGS